MTKYIPYIAVLLLAVAIFQLFEQSATIKGLEAEKKITQNLLEDQKEANQRLIDSLNKESQKDIIEAKSKAIDSIIKIWRNKPKGTYNEEIDTIDNSDTTRIAREFAKFYPDNN